MEPLAVTRSEFPPMIEKLLTDPDARVRVPDPPVIARAQVPALFGAKIPPALMVVPVIEPLPDRVAPPLTVSPEDGATDPSTRRVAVPPTVVLPV